MTTPPGKVPVGAVSEVDDETYVPGFSPPVEPGLPRPARPRWRRRLLVGVGVLIVLAGIGVGVYLTGIG